MSARFLVLAALVAAPSAFAMGQWQGEHAPAEAELSTVQVNAPSIARPGAGSADAVRYLAGLSAPSPQPVPPSTTPAFVATTRPALPPSAPPVDVSIQFRREVTAVLTSGEPHVVLAGGRRLRRGEVYRDGWKLSSVTTQQAVLAKGRETRSINLFSAPPVEAVQIASAPLVTRPLAFSNGMTPEQRAAQLQQMQAQQMQGRGGRGRGDGRNAGPNSGFGGGRGFGGGGGGGFNGGFGAGGGFRTGGFNGAPSANVSRQGANQVTVVAPPPPPPPPPPPSIEVRAVDADD